MNKESFNFKDIIDSSVLNISTGSSLTVLDVMVALLVTLVCSAIIVWTYRNTYQGVLYQRSFSVAIILASLVTTSIIMVISGNLILSLGMVGALSIVRFRSAIKDPMDIVYMFWAIAIGIANGVAYLKVSLTTTVLLSIIMLWAKKIPEISSPYLLIVNHEVDTGRNLKELLKKNTKKAKIRSRTVKGSSVETIFEVRGFDEDDLSRKMSTMDGNCSYTLVSYQNNS